MAKPIKETPVIKGKDALRFRKNLAKAEKITVSAIQLATMRDNYNKIMSIAVQAR